MNIHFIAIGGSAMHSLAIALQRKEYHITGSDDAIFEPSRSRLENENILPQKMGWDASKITSNLDAVILGMHAREDNPELTKAKELGIRIYSYPEFIFEQSKNKTRVVIGGSHGKTSITSMILHVMNYHNREIDYMVGATLEGLDNPVHLTQENDFIVIEGDEYLSSAIDRRPKFHLYQPNIALLSGIAWDHINVFPTYQNYVEQFKIFINSIVNGGILVYNEEDQTVKELAETTENPIRKHPYYTPDYHTEDNTTILDAPEGELPLEIFGKHNMNNLAGSKWICQHMGIDEDDFYEAIATFKGASKRLEKVAETSNGIIIKDFAHSPSKVAATTAAVKEQYPNRKLIACLELHTYSSLNADFLKEYKNTLEKADEALVFYSPDAVAIKKLDDVSEDQIEHAFQKQGLKVYTSPENFEAELKDLGFNNSVLLMMSSGNYGGLDMESLKELI
ncbi:UDP-N-acetylmuramate--L-alanine ligase [Christiangramia sp. OXR-203]|jgi:UDP-N-acetylmuramate--alanine ligase/UDP-N-acetylmuramate: L-alanyl-gamma-D-glutamyl-meso-diaminopimelate ligase|uniref:UDP-N-acetylmuramate--L-alanine ligase n=1 Tax=Christiangramia sp. OXR-203 TaxID=3100176 RepID=UPI002AC98E9D|nr:Mur ligase family protein [Christiangramia sp. OXR-203]WPY99111.1 Mur ligase family protein [Christiangramia sp. OXR-203]